MKAKFLDDFLYELRHLANPAYSNNILGSKLEAKFEAFLNLNSDYQRIVLERLLSERRLQRIYNESKMDAALIHDFFCIGLNVTNTACYNKSLIFMDNIFTTIFATTDIDTWKYKQKQFFCSKVNEDAFTASSGIWQPVSFSAVFDFMEELSFLQCGSRYNMYAIFQDLGTLPASSFRPLTNESLYLNKYKRFISSVNNSTNLKINSNSNFIYKPESPVLYHVYITQQDLALLSFLNLFPFKDIVLFLRELPDDMLFKYIITKHPKKWPSFCKNLLAYEGSLFFTYFLNFLQKFDFFSLKSVVQDSLKVLGVVYFAKLGIFFMDDAFLQSSYEWVVFSDRFSISPRILREAYLRSFPTEDELMELYDELGWLDCEGLSDEEIDYYYENEDIFEELVFTVIEEEAQANAEFDIEFEEMYDKYVRKLFRFKDIPFFIRLMARWESIKSFFINFFK